MPSTLADEPPSARNILPRTHINDLPTDVIREIFLFCIPPSAFLVSIRQSPINLTGTCSSWRELAQDMSDLWTSLTIKKSIGPKFSNATAEAIKRWSEGAKHRALSLSCEFSDISTDCSNPLIAITALLPFSTKIRNLKLVMPLALYVPLADIPVGEMAHLESLSLESSDVGGYNTWPVQNRIRIDVAECPNLQSLSLISHAQHGFYRHVLSNIPWWQLISLTLHEETLHQKTIHSILARCQKLMFCDLWFKGNSFFMPVTAFTYIVLEHLTSLTLRIGDHFSSSIGSLLDALTLPVLQTLIITADRPTNDHTGLGVSISALQSRARTPLCTLALRRIRMPVVSTLCLLRSLRGLERLELEAVRFQEYLDVLGGLAYEQEETENILPNLVSLFISTSIPHGLDEFIHLQEVETLDEQALRVVQTRYWEEGSCVHRQSGLKRLEDVTLAWLNVRSGWYQRDVIGRGKWLSKLGLNLEMPNYTPTASYYRSL